MLKSYRADTIIAFLLERCSLTTPQLDTLMISRLNEKLGEKVLLRDRKKVSKGAFLHTLRQGENNVKSALYTLLLLEYLGLVDPKELIVLGRVGDLISRVRDSSPSPEEIGKLLRGMEEFADSFTAGHFA